MPRNEDKQRCGALTGVYGSGKGRRCRNWARQGSDAPLCEVHARKMAPRLPEAGERRCTMITKSGARCRRWGLKGTDPAVCNVHGGRHRSRLPDAAEQAAGRRCTAIAASTGEQCRMWAMLESERIYGQALCMAHAGVRQKASRMPGDDEERCTARTLDGKRCRRWAVSTGGGEALCWIHAFPKAHGKITHGFFRQVPYFTEEQQAFIAELAREGEPLSAEALVVRLKLLGMIAYLNRPGLPVAERRRVTEVILGAVTTVSRLLRAQKKLARVGWGPSTAGGARRLLELTLESEREGVNG